MDFKMMKLLLIEFLKINRTLKKIIMMLVDSSLVILSLFFSFSLRLGSFYFPSGDLLLAFLAAPIFALPVFYSFNLYQSVVRYIGYKSMIAIGQAIILYSLAWGLVTFMASIDGIPRSVILINCMVCILLIGGSRIFAKFIINSKYHNIYKSTKNILIYGAGSAGRQLLSAFNNSTDYNAIGYIEDNTTLQRHYINGVKVYSPTEIPELIVKYKVNEVLLAMPSISRKRKKQIIENLNIFPINVKSLPSIKNLAEGKLKVDDLLEVNISDLLGRESVRPNKDLLKIKITDKVVMVTGAGGSIGSELSKQIIFLKPKKIILFDISEPSLYHVEQNLESLGINNVEIHAVLGSVRSKQHFEYVCNHYKVQTIYHAAAYKHVPLVEINPSEGALNNVIGTLIAAQVAICTGVESFVLISTDKAVRPANIMGATKRVAELILQALSSKSNSTCFTMVRFGNVLDSSGSVIPLFKKQIRKGGPLTVTDKNILRYFMTIPEAVELVIQAGAMAKGGDVFVLDMGDPIRINDLAVKMIQLSGLEVLNHKNPNGDIEIKYTGLRPGEKLYEELLVDAKATNTDHRLIMRAEEKMILWEYLEPVLLKLKEAALKSDSLKVRELLTQLVPEFKTTSKEENQKKL
jgi:FlaA1/EpsC-like NDP-sugar epimerase